MSAKARWLRLNVDWDDSKWVEPLSESGQLAFVKLLCYVKASGTKGRIRSLSVARAASKWSVKPRGVQEMLSAAFDDGAITLDGDDWVLTNWLTYQQEDNSNAERQQRWRNTRKQDNGVLNGDNEPITDHNGTITPLSRRVTETDTSKKEVDKSTSKEKRTRMVKPTPEEVAAYAVELGMPKSQGGRAYDHWLSKGWKVGNSPMQDWKASLRTWKAGWIDRGSPIEPRLNGKHPAPTPDPTAGFREI